MHEFKCASKKNMNTSRRRRHHRRRCHCRCHRRSINIIIIRISKDVIEFDGVQIIIILYYLSLDLALSLSPFHDEFAVVRVMCVCATNTTYMLTCSECLSSVLVFVHAHLPYQCGCCCCCCCRWWWRCVCVCVSLRLSQMKSGARKFKNYRHLMSSKMYANRWIRNALIIYTHASARSHVRAHIFQCEFECKCDTAHTHTHKPLKCKNDGERANGRGNSTRTNTNRSLCMQSAVHTKISAQECTDTGVFLLLFYVCIHACTMWCERIIQAKTIAYIGWQW